MIKYPNNIIKSKKIINNYGNRGMTLESEINISNKYYLDNDIAVVYKKPTPIKMVKQENGKIVNAFFESPSTTDYNGLFNGKYIDFEAKETKSSSFPLKNIHSHQIKHLKSVVQHGGIGFLIVRFVKTNETYLLFAKDFLFFVEKESRKSVPISFFRENGYLIKDKLKPVVDYIEIIDKYGGIL